MKERLKNIKANFSGFWSSRTKVQKGTIIGSIIAILLIASIITYFTTRVTYAPLFSDLSAAEVGQIKEQLDSKGVKYQVTNGGTAISVPEDQVDNLKVDLASQGFPQSGQIDYSFFSKNAGFGMTDNEFNVLKLASMQTELANLMKDVKGVKDAKVMITLPEKGVFVSDTQQEASASIVLNTEPGYQFTESQIKTLYNLASKSVPNLKPENIVITNQYFEYYDLNTQTASAGDGISSSDSNKQLEIKKQIERDLQRQVQTMLGQLMGAGKAAVTVTTDIDFTQEKREENLVEPVDKENMAGIQISAQKINETYTGTGNAAGGTPEADQNTDNFTDYQSTTNGNGDYEKTEDTVNYEVNRIKRKITESPYRVRDIGIQVLVEPPKPGDPTSLPQATQDNIKNMLASIVRTSIDKNEAGQLTNAQVNQKVTVAVEKMNGKAQMATAQKSSIPWWIYVIGGILLVVIGLLVFFIVRSRREEYDEDEYDYEDEEELDIEDISDEKETETTLRRKQLEKMAKEKPDEFAKLLRTWISED